MYNGNKLFPTFYNAICNGKTFYNPHSTLRKATNSRSIYNTRRKATNLRSIYNELKSIYKIEKAYRLNVDGHKIHINCVLTRNKKTANEVLKLTTFVKYRWTDAELVYILMIVFIK